LFPYLVSRTFDLNFCKNLTPSKYLSTNFLSS